MKTFQEFAASVAADIESIAYANSYSTNYALDYLSGTAFSILFEMSHREDMTKHARMFNLSFDDSLFFNDTLEFEIAEQILAQSKALADRPISMTAVPGVAVTSAGTAELKRALLRSVRTAKSIWFAEQLELAVS